jgi:hypothetical protein
MYGWPDGPGPMDGLRHNPNMLGPMMSWHEGDSALGQAGPMVRLGLDRTLGTGTTQKLNMHDKASQMTS